MKETITNGRDKNVSMTWEAATKEYPYYENMDKVLISLEKALKFRDGNISDVTNDDILATSDIDREVYDALFTNPRGIIRAIQRIVTQRVEELNCAIQNSDDHSLLVMLFLKLSYITPILRVLSLLNNASVWNAGLRGLAKKITASRWGAVDSRVWEYLYANFCYQFQSVLNVWTETGYDERQLERCVQLCLLWLDADALLSERGAELI